jgi:hypothetical protein
MLLRKINRKDFGDERTLEIVDWSRVERMVAKEIEQPASHESIECLDMILDCFRGVDWMKA